MNKVILLIFATTILWSCGSDDEPTIVVPQNDQTYSPRKVRSALDQEQREAFRLFYDGACPETGWAYEGTGRGEVITTGGTGFGIMALIVGAERGFITRAQAVDRVLKIVNFSRTCSRFQGMWSHWYNKDGTAHAFGDQDQTGDIIESAFLIAGMLTASEYFTGADDAEKQIRKGVAECWNTVNWRFYTNNKNVLYWLWYSKENRFSLDVRGWHEGWETYLFALAAPEPHNISQTVYTEGWLGNGSIYKPDRKHYGYNLPMGEDLGGCMFFAHYSFLGLDPRKIEDEKVNYWQQNVAHTMINRHYCLEEAPKNFKYSEGAWGLSACYGARDPWTYKARSPKNDDGVMAFTAALGSYPYTPFYSTQVMLNFTKNAEVHGIYGFCDSYCPETDTKEKKHLAIDQGPIVVMMENYRSSLIWNLMMKNEHVKRGLQLAGVKSKPNFKPGFHIAMVNTKTGEYDMMMHPDREKYEIDYFVEQGGKISFTLHNANQELVRTIEVDALAGENLLSFDDTDILKGKKYTLKMAGSSHSITVKLR